MNLEESYLKIRQILVDDLERFNSEIPEFKASRRFAKETLKHLDWEWKQFKNKYKEGPLAKINKAINQAYALGIPRNVINSLRYSELIAIIKEKELQKEE